MHGRVRLSRRLLQAPLGARLQATDGAREASRARRVNVSLNPSTNRGNVSASSEVVPDPVLARARRVNVSLNPSTNRGNVSASSEVVPDPVLEQLLDHRSRAHRSRLRAGAREASQDDFG